MTEEIIIDVNNCPHKRDGDCIEMPICNEYGDLMSYQSCEAQTLCPYRSQKKIERLEQENKELKKDVQLFKCLNTFGESECHCACRCLGNEFCEDADKKINIYRSALKEIKEDIRSFCGCEDSSNDYKLVNMIDKINEVLK